MRKKKGLSIIDLMKDPALFGRWFQGNSWIAWTAFLKSLFGIPGTQAEREIFRQFTGRNSLPGIPAEAWLVIGRRGGKSLIAALIAVYLACFKSYSRYLAPGEVATVMIIAADRRQARVCFRYIKGFLESVPMLRAMIVSHTKESITLTNRVVIEIHTCSFRSVRGYTLAAVIADEVAFWRSEDSANPAAEVLNGLRPGMTTIPGALLLCLSSPYARKEEVWNAYRKHFANNSSPVLVWQASTQAMNPLVPQAVIERALKEDESAARAEYFAEFRRDIESYINNEAVEAVTIPGRSELPVQKVRYSAFVDPSGGSQDAMSLAIAHRERDKVILDLVKEVRPPFSPELVVKEFAKILKTYRVFLVRGDRYGGLWPQEQFNKNGVRYVVSQLTKSDLYSNLLPLLKGLFRNRNRILGSFGVVDEKTHTRFLHKTQLDQYSCGVVYTSVSCVSATVLLWYRKEPWQMVLLTATKRQKTQTGKSGSKNGGISFRRSLLQCQFSSSFPPLH